MQMSNSPKRNHFISVIIPTLGRKSLSDTLAALEKQTRKPDEIIVVLDKDRKGPGWARNQGISMSHGDLVAFTDDDCIPPVDWLEDFVQTLDEYKADGVGGSYDETDTILKEKHSRRKFPLVPLVDDYGWVGNSANVMYKRVWLDILQNRDNYVFNEQMFSGQDIECAWRLRRYGAKLVYSPKNVIHLKKIKAHGFFRQQFTKGIGIAQLYLAYKGAGTAVTNQGSLIWGNTRKSWMTVLFYRILGPFDVHNSTSIRYFFIYWAGEKFQALGFVFYLVRNNWGRPSRSQ